MESLKIIFIFCKLVPQHLIFFKQASDLRWKCFPWFRVRFVAKESKNKDEGTAENPDERVALPGAWNDDIWRDQTTTFSSEENLSLNILGRL